MSCLCLPHLTERQPAGSEGLATVPASGHRRVPGRLPGGYETHGRLGPVPLRVLQLYTFRELAVDWGAWLPGGWLSGGGGVNIFDPPHMRKESEVRQNTRLDVCLQ